jgi:hypothetical protein
MIFSMVLAIFAFKESISGLFEPKVISDEASETIDRFLTLSFALPAGLLLE